MLIDQDISDEMWSEMLFALRDSPCILPTIPPDELQRHWNGDAGHALAAQSVAFYKLSKQVFADHGPKPLEEARVLDFGCGWGRLIRYWIRDLPAEQLFGCDPDANILQWCRDIPANFAVSDFSPNKLPFDQQFDLIYAYSIFTHLSQAIHWQCLRAIHQALTPGGIVILTIRPWSFIERKALELAKLSDDRLRYALQEYDNQQYIFVPADVHAQSPLRIDGEITYGDAVIPESYAREHWSELFEFIVRIDFAADPQQIPIVLRKN